MYGSGSITTVVMTVTHVLLAVTACTCLSGAFVLLAVRYSSRLRQHVASDQSLYVGRHRGKTSLRDSILGSAVSLRQILIAARGAMPLPDDRSHSAP